jgi:hypothetical protein
VIEHFGAWLHGTPLGWAASGGIPWLEPTCKALHFIGLVLLFGGAGAFDLRVLGVARALPVGPLQRLTPVAVLGFLLNLATGVTFFAGNPAQYLDNVAFWLKMLFVVLAGANALVFYAGGLGRAVARVGAGEDAPGAAKVVAAVSLCLWVGVIYWGRMLAYVGNAF